MNRTITGRLALLAPLFLSFLPTSAGALQGRHKDVQVSLPFGISLVVPEGWRTNRPELAIFLSPDAEISEQPIDIRPDASGHLVAFASPLERTGEASLEISIMPTKVSQGKIGALSEAELAEANRSFRAETEGALAHTGLTLIAWEGTIRTRLGGQFALLRRYRFRYPEGPTMQMESYGVYLGTRSIQLRIQYADDSSPSTMREIDRIRRSVQLALSSL